MMTGLFALGHRCHPSSLRMFLHFVSHPTTSPSIVSLRACAQGQMFSQQLWFFSMPLSLINCINTTIAGAFTTPYLGACIAQFEGPTLLIVCL
jgi:hypothetical protein